MLKTYLVAGLVSLAIHITAQVPNYLGGDPNHSIVVTTSSDQYRPGWTEWASGDKTIDCSGLDAKKMAASRFLAQASLGADLRTIEEVAVQDNYEEWIDSQFENRSTFYLETLIDVYGNVFDNYINEGGDPNDFRCRPKWYHANYGWWEMIIRAEDLLRQRIALALSEILVISKENSELENYGY
ncbi:MAG: hypothetical protein OEQ53_12710, partial [Saprospiraceae bacterium]|nr:hypothetical protein [Saprospiraceae bacterium]